MQSGINSYSSRLIEGLGSFWQPGRILFPIPDKQEDITMWKDKSGKYGQIDFSLCKLRSSISLHSNNA